MILLAVIFLLAAAPAAHAYIDPGTGSMLFSLITGLTVTAFFFLKNLFIKLRSGMLGGKKAAAARNAAQSASRYGLVIYSEGKQYWNVFKPILEELARRGLPCAYFSSSPDDPGLTLAGQGLAARFIGEGNEAFRFLNFLEADTCLMTTPGLDVFQLKRSPGVKRYVHIVHMVTDTTTYRLFSLDYFDAVLLAAGYQAQAIRALEALRGTRKKDLHVVGCTYLDALAEKLQALRPPPPSEPTVLVAPSWGKNGLLQRFGAALLEPLARSRYRVIVRPHPQSLIVEKDLIASLRDALAPYPTVEWDTEAENLRSLSRASALISDFSGVIFDYAFLFGRPVLYPAFEFDKRPYDAGDLDAEPWVLGALRRLGAPLTEDAFPRIAARLDETLSAAASPAVINQLRSEAYPYPGQAAKRAVDFLCA
ncbi:MAG: CDP-glycerol glycerophosphotransferase family protein [Treponema sp.]|jgi:hypothetical protein|nr:CDP-glycerol glycerophosphotransferase family protein [Treponema sp.]